MPGDHWLVCHTKPRCEKKFAALLVAEKIEHYLPLIESVRHYGGRSKKFTKPLFPGYVFTHVTPDQRPRMYQQDLLARAIGIDDEKKFLRQLADVKTIVASGLQLTVMPLLGTGRRVRIRSGPLRGLEGFVYNPANPKGIILSVDVLQQGLLVRLHAELLQPLP